MESLWNCWENITKQELHPHHRKKELFLVHLKGNTRSKSWLLKGKAVERKMMMVFWKKGKRFDVAVPWLLVLNPPSFLFWDCLQGGCPPSSESYSGQRIPLKNTVTHNYFGGKRDLNPKSTKVKEIHLHSYNKNYVNGYIVSTTYFTSIDSTAW